MRKKDEPSLVDGLEMTLGKPLNPEEREAVDLWEKGKALSHVVNSYAWDVILDTLKRYEEDATERLKSTDPSDQKEVILQHAVVFAAARIYGNFVEDVNRAVEAAKSAPPVVKRGVKMLGVPPEAV